mmetsp:Transcript_3399/g.7714  ORF Transcript_3399/g.7714 Transcript_3399/m.7714 type:complete len:378 (+) Transcript_3399:162-1295(+)
MLHTQHKDSRDFKSKVDFFERNGRAEDLFLLRQSVNASAARVGEGLDDFRADYLLREKEAQREALCFVDAHVDLLHVNIEATKQLAERAYQEEDVACGIVAQQVENCRERNVDAAVHSLEMAMLQCDEMCMQKIEARAEALETLIPKTQRKLNEAKKGLVRSHDSSELLGAAAWASYHTMRDSYLGLIRQTREEADVQWREMQQLVAPTMRWQLDKMAHIHSTYRDCPRLITRREEVLSAANSRFEDMCGRSFERVRNSGQYREQEELLLKLEGVRRRAAAWKASTVQAEEEKLTQAEVQSADEYTASLQLLYDHLFSLQVGLDQLVTYDKRLQQLIEKTRSRETQATALRRCTTLRKPLSMLKIYLPPLSLYYNVY